MENFTLDRRLKKDCCHLLNLDFSAVLVMDNKLVPWFILVPFTTKTEIVDLSKVDQSKLYSEIDILSQFIRSKYHIDKLNTAAIGNIVSQLHIHIIGRSKTDYAWPDVVWGKPEKQFYSSKEIETIKHDLTAFISTNKQH